MENTRDYRHIDLVNTEAKADRLTKQPSFRAHHIFHDDLIAIERYQTSVQMDKPIYTGAAVLELSKLLMLDFHYDFIKEQYPGSKSTLAFTDTDSLLYAIETENNYDDIWTHRERFDISNYPNEHEIFQGRPELVNPETGCIDPELLKAEKNKNKKVVGKFKGEAEGELILEFVGLRAKAYAFLQESYDVETEKYIINESKKLKGIKKCVVKKKIHFKHYKDCLFSGKDHYASMVTFRSKLHKISTIEQVKKALSRYDDKRFIHRDGITTTAHGHTDNIFEFIDF